MQPTGVVSYYSKLGHWDLEKMVARDKKLDGSSSMFVVGGILKCKSNAIDERAYTFTNLFIPTGGWVEVEFMAKSISGVGKMSVDLFDNGAFTGDPPVDSLTISDRQWKYYRFNVPITQGLNYARLLFGQWKSSVGETWFKDISIKAYNTNPQPDFRFAAIKGNRSSWNLQDGIGEYANEGIVSARVVSDYIEVVHVPFNTWYKPIYTATVLRDGNATNIMATIGTQAVDPERTCRIYLVNPGTGAKIDVTTITADMTIFFEAKAR